MTEHDCGSAALSALSANDPKAMAKAFEAGNMKYLNSKVNDGVYCGAQVKEYEPALQHQEGDTMLHLALRNKKWPIKTVCVVELGMDAFLPNAAFITPPMMQLQESIPRLGVAAAAALALYYDVLDLGGLTYGSFIASCVMIAVSLVDLALAVRWWRIAKHNHLNPGSKRHEKKSASEKAGKKGKKGH